MAETRSAAYRLITCFFSVADRSDLGMKRAVLNEHMGFGDLADKTGLVNLAREMIHDDDLRIIPPSSSRSTFEGVLRMLRFKYLSRKK